MPSEPLDLREFERQLTGLERDLGGRALRDIMVNGAEVFQQRWRDNISDDALIDTGAYLESLSVEVVDNTPEFIRVAVGTDVRNEAGEPYPFFLEYGTSEMPPHPVGIRAFDSARRRVVADISDGIERKVKSRSRR